MIVIFGRADDPPISLVLESLQECGFKYCFVELRALDRDGLHVQAGSTGLMGHLMVAGQRLSLETVKSVYARPLSPGRQWPSPQAAQRALLTFNDFNAWLDVAPALVINRPLAMNSNNSKPMQMQWIGNAGFLVPETLITSSQEEAFVFWRTHGRVIYKSSSGVRSIVRELDEASAQKLDLLRHLPVQFQAFVPGIDVRVHVVGQQSFAAEIHSSATDYRYTRGSEHTDLQVHELPNEVSERCVQLAKTLELPLAGVDLRLRPDGNYVCFEVNPMPAFSYYESNTNLPISLAVAQLLAAGN